MKNQNTIQQIAKQYNVPAQEVIDFLNDKGIAIDFAYQKIEDKVYNQLEKELKTRKKVPLLFVSDEDISNFKPVTKPIEFWQDANIPNLEKLIYKNLAFEKSKAEKIIGLTPFNWCYAKIKYNIKYAKGVKFSLFEDTVCEIIKLRKDISIIELCNILGFGNDTEIIVEVVNGLKTDDIIQVVGNYEKLSLTSKGEQDIQKKQKSKPSQSATFDLFFDDYYLENTLAKEIFGNQKAKKVQNKLLDFSNFELVKLLAEEQQPNFQSSKSGFILQEAIPINESIEFFELRFIAIVTEDLENKSKNKIWIFNPYTKEISKPLTNIALKSENLYNVITEKLHSEIKEQVVVVIEKEKEQIEFDQLLVQASKEKQTKKSIPNEFLHFLTPDSLDTVQFEDEMEKLFEVCKEQLWLIFPFAYGKIIDKRIKLIKKALNNGCSVFVGFTENENFGGKAVIDESAIQLLENLSNSNPLFIYAELPKFHDKRVFAYLNDTIKCEYSGSQNYLSFYVPKGVTNVRRENMKRIIWSENSDIELTMRKVQLTQSYSQRVRSLYNEDLIIVNALSAKDKLNTIERNRSHIIKLNNLIKINKSNDKLNIDLNNLVKELEIFNSRISDKK